MNMAYLVSAILSAEYSDEASSSCVTIAILLHYFVLSSLLWMLVEAMHMHQLLITVFSSSETHVLLKRMLLAWGECWPVACHIVSY